MSSSSASSSPFALPSPDHHHHHLSSSSSSDQLCYVRCEFCETVLAVCVPCTSLFKTVTVRCGHCTNLLSVNMRALLLPPPPTSHLQLSGHSFFGGPPPPPGQNNLLLEEMRNSSPSNNLLMHPAADSFLPVRDIDDLPKTPAVKRPPEKRQRVPSAYNRFIKDEIQRIKTGNPDISHREAFSAAAKNWAHFPHIHFGLMPDQPVKKPNVLYQQQEGDDHLMMKDGFLGAAAANVGLAPY